MPTAQPNPAYENVGGAWIHPGARLAGGVILEPGAVVGDGVEVGDGTWVGAGAVIHGPTRIGVGNQIYPTAVIGGPPQDIGFGDEPTRLEIGDHNTLREGVTIHRASTKEVGVTRVGSNNYFMVNSHVGHDAIVGDHVTAANGTLIAGHCRVGSHANFSGGVALMQFVTVGRHAFVGALAGTRRDLEPFVLHDIGVGIGPESTPQGINIIGLQRSGFSAEVIRSLRTAFKLLFPKDGTVDLAQVRAELAAKNAACAETEELVAFAEAKSVSRFGRVHHL